MLLLTHFDIGSAPAYLADYCTSTSLVSGRSALRSAAHDDIVVPSHRTVLGLRSSAVAGPSRWNASPVHARSQGGFDWFDRTPLSQVEPPPSQPGPKVLFLNLHACHCM